MTAGQGVSRLSYQKGRSLGNKGTRAPAVAKYGAEASTKREYAKKGDYPAGINVSYGDTINPTDLKDVVELGRLKPPKGR
jgi:hypothetical protein